MKPVPIFVHHSRSNLFNTKRRLNDLSATQYTLAPPITTIVPFPWILLGGAFADLAGARTENATPPDVNVLAIDMRVQGKRFFAAPNTPMETVMEQHWDATKLDSYKTLDARLPEKTDAWMKAAAFVRQEKEDHSKLEIINVTKKHFQPSGLSPQPRLLVMTSVATAPITSAEAGGAWAELVNVLYHTELNSVHLTHRDLHWQDRLAWELQTQFTDPVFPKENALVRQYLGVTRKSSAAMIPVFYETWARVPSWDYCIQYVCPRTATKTTNNPKTTSDRGTRIFNRLALATHLMPAMIRQYDPDARFEQPAQSGPINFDFHRIDQVPVGQSFFDANSPPQATLAKGLQNTVMELPRNPLLKSASIATNMALKGNPLGHGRYASPAIYQRCLEETIVGLFDLTYETLVVTITISMSADDARRQQEFTGALPEGAAQFVWNDPQEGDAPDVRTCTITMPARFRCFEQTADAIESQYPLRGVTNTDTQTTDQIAEYALRLEGARGKKVATGRLQQRDRFRPKNFTAQMNSVRQVGELIMHSPHTGVSLQPDGADKFGGVGYHDMGATPLFITTARPAVMGGPSARLAGFPRHALVLAAYSLFDAAFDPTVVYPYLRDYGSAEYEAMRALGRIARDALHTRLKNRGDSDRENFASWEDVAFFADCVRTLMRDRMASMLRPDNGERARTAMMHLLKGMLTEDFTSAQLTNHVRITAGLDHTHTLQDGYNALYRWKPTELPLFHRGPSTMSSRGSLVGFSPTLLGFTRTALERLALPIPGQPFNTRDEAQPPQYSPPPSPQGPARSPMREEEEEVLQDGVGWSLATPDPVSREALPAEFSASLPENFIEIMDAAGYFNDLRYPNAPATPTIQPLPSEHFAAAPATPFDLPGDTRATFSFGHFGDDEFDVPLPPLSPTGMFRDGPATPDRLIFTVTTPEVKDAPAPLPPPRAQSARQMVTTTTTTTTSTPTYIEHGKPPVQELTPIATVRPLPNGTPVVLHIQKIARAPATPPTLRPEPEPEMRIPDTVTYLSDLPENFPASFEAIPYVRIPFIKDDLEITGYWAMRRPGKTALDVAKFMASRDIHVRSDGALEKRARSPTPEYTPERESDSDIYADEFLKELKAANMRIDALGNILPSITHPHWPAYVAAMRNVSTKEGGMLYGIIRTIFLERDTVIRYVRDASTASSRWDIETGHGRYAHTINAWANRAKALVEIVGRLFGFYCKGGLQPTGGDASSRYVYSVHVSPSDTLRNEEPAGISNAFIAVRTHHRFWHDDAHRGQSYVPVQDPGRPDEDLITHHALMGSDPASSKEFAERTRSVVAVYGTVGATSEHPGFSYPRRLFITEETKQLHTMGYDWDGATMAWRPTTDRNRTTQMLDPENQADQNVLERLITEYSLMGEGTGPVLSSFVKISAKRVLDKYGWRLGEEILAADFDALRATNFLVEAELAGAGLDYTRTDTTVTLTTLEKNRKR